MNLKLNIRFVSQEKLEQYHDAYCLPENRGQEDSLGLPYTYHEVYGELVRREQGEISMDVVQTYWNNLKPDEKIELMKKASGLSNPSAVAYFSSPPEIVRNYILTVMIDVENKTLENHKK